jgi:hypothetical protein
MTFALSPGEAHDAPEGRKLPRVLGKSPRPRYLVMHAAYEGNVTRRQALDLGFIPVPTRLMRRATRGFGVDFPNVRHYLT